MKVWKGFIRRNKGWLGLFTGMTASHLFYLYLMRAPKADLVYSTCIDVGIFLVIFLVMWITYQKKVQRLRQFLSCPLENNMQLPEAEEFLEELYTELFSRANEERAEAMRRAGARETGAAGILCQMGASDQNTDRCYAAFIADAEGRSAGKI